jgi:hypothetical protein
MKKKQKHKTNDGENNEKPYNKKIEIEYEFNEHAISL